MVSINAVKAIARKEFTDKLNNRWIVVISIAFTVFTIIISYFGSSVSGVTGFREMAPTIASLTSLVIYFIPILALTLGGGVIADERDRHTLDIYLASPISVSEFIAGKFIGLSISLSLPTIIGFMVSGIVLFLNITNASILSYILFIVHSIILGLIFLSISFLVSVLFYDRAKVIAFTVFAWLFFTVLYDLGLIGVLVVSKGRINVDILSILLMFNPIDIYRIMNFMSIGEYSLFLGLSSIEFPKFLNMPVLWGICMIWIVVPLTISFSLFKRKYLT
ncbi:MAG: ABC transporter permease subunit [Nitrospirae bacterium]|nr:ABC transporter permease subunit [Nitrospirota bacterium]MBF0542330.1 ABC transporter permease subunit [Nitrospirota bacterium]